MDISLTDLPYDASILMNQTANIINQYGQIEETNPLSSQSINNQAEIDQINMNQFNMNQLNQQINNSYNNYPSPEILGNSSYDINISNLKNESLSSSYLRQNDNGTPSNVNASPSSLLLNQTGINLSHNETMTLLDYNVSSVNSSTSSNTKNLWNDTRSCSVNLNRLNSVSTSSAVSNNLYSHNPSYLQESLNMKINTNPLYRRSSISAQSCHSNSRLQNSAANTINKSSLLTYGGNVTPISPNNNGIVSCLEIANNDVGHLRYTKRKSLSQQGKISSLNRISSNSSISEVNGGDLLSCSPSIISPNNQGTLVDSTTNGLLQSCSSHSIVSDIDSPAFKENIGLIQQQQSELLNSGFILPTNLSTHNNFSLGSDVVITDSLKNALSGNLGERKSTISSALEANTLPSNFLTTSTAANSSAVYFTRPEQHAMHTLLSNTEPNVLQMTTPIASSFDSSYSSTTSNNENIINNMINLVDNTLTNEAEANLGNNSSVAETIMNLDRNTLMNMNQLQTINSSMDTLASVNNFGNIKEITTVNDNINDNIMSVEDINKAIMDDFAPLPENMENLSNMTSSNSTSISSISYNSSINRINERSESLSNVFGHTLPTSSTSSTNFKSINSNNLVPHLVNEIDDSTSTTYTKKISPSAISKLHIHNKKKINSTTTTLSQTIYANSSISSKSTTKEDNDTQKNIPSVLKKNEKSKDEKKKITNTKTYSSTSSTNLNKKQAYGHKRKNSELYQEEEQLKMNILLKNKKSDLNTMKKESSDHLLAIVEKEIEDNQVITSTMDSEKKTICVENENKPNIKKLNDSVKMEIDEIKSSENMLKKELKKTNSSLNNMVDMKGSKKIQGDKEINNKKNGKVSNVNTSSPSKNKDIKVVEKKDNLNKKAKMNVLVNTSNNKLVKGKNEEDKEKNNLNSKKEKINNTKTISSDSSKTSLDTTSTLKDDKKSNLTIKSSKSSLTDSTTNSTSENQSTTDSTTHKRPRFSLKNAKNDPAAIELHILLKRRRNTEAARRSRQRKVEQMRNLENKVENFTKEVEELQNKLKNANDEKKELMEEIIVKDTLYSQQRDEFKSLDEQKSNYIKILQNLLQLNHLNYPNKNFKSFDDIAAVATAVSIVNTKPSNQISAHENEEKILDVKMEDKIEGNEN